MSETFNFSAYHFGLLAFFVTTLLVLLLNPVARRLGWVDEPTGRKIHRHPVPYTGGISIALAVGVLALLWSWPEIALGLGLGYGMLFVAGFIDDRVPVRARYRFMVQLAAGLTAVLSGEVMVVSLGYAFSPVFFALGSAAVPFTLLAMAGVTNAFNMADGADGLCGGYVGVALISFLAAAAVVDLHHPAAGAVAELLPIVVPVLGALAGFLVFNMRFPGRERASTFLGDGGSMALGFLVAWVAVRMAGGYGQGAALSPVVAVWFIALPLMDLFGVIIGRLLRGERPMTADSCHMHHLLLAHGLPVSRVVPLLHLTAALLSVIALGAWQLAVPDYFLFWGLVLAFIVYCAYSHLFWRERVAYAPYTGVSLRKGG